MNSEILRAVYQHELLSEKNLEAVFHAHKKVKFSKGDYILNLGTTPNRYLVLESGLIRSYVLDYNGNDITTNFFTKKDLVIEVSSLFQRIPSQENIEVLSECTCWQIDFQTFQELFHSIEGFREWGRAWLSNSLFEFKQRSVSMITNSATERYTNLMDSKPEVFQHSPLKHIASYLGITDTSLSRIRKEMLKA
jgi:CRP-like cAMP-binding protein